MNKFLLKLGEYQIWANNKYREILSNISEEEWEKELDISIKSIKVVCTHITLAIERCLTIILKEHDLYPEDIIPIQGMSKEELLEKWHKNDNLFCKLLKTRTNEKVRFNGFRFMDTHNFLFQYVNHTSYHRGQLVIALRLIGKEATNTDYLFYLQYLHHRSESS